MADFAIRMRDLGRQVEDKTNALTRRVALAVDQAVVFATPVDTGRARSNWLASLIIPARSTPEAAVPGSQGSTAGPNAAAALSQARTVIARRKSGQDIYLSNNLSYIGNLNDGSSAQAPAGFVETAIMIGQRVAAAGFSLR